MREVLGMHKTLNQQLSSAAREHGQSGAVNALLREIADAAKQISAAVRLGELSADLRGPTGARNVSGEQVQKLDLYANDLLIDTLRQCGLVAILASEENDEVVPLSDDSKEPQYIVAIDPLDGSSNIDTNASIGTIFSILGVYRGSPDQRDLFRRGVDQLAAGYAIYGSSTILVYTARCGVHGFILDISTGNFLLSHSDIQCPARGTTYSINEGYASYWSKSQRDLMDWYKEPDNATSRPYKARYVGSLVADFHRTLVKGGIFMYPGDSRAPRGKLRYLYEASPLALVCEEAGGAASDGAQRILDIKPSGLHERVPLYIGSREMVEQAAEFLRADNGG